MPHGPFPPPRPQPGGPTTDMDADFPHLGFAIRFRNSWDFFDAAQELIGAWFELGHAPQPGSNISLGFNVFFAHQREPGVFTITAPRYRGNGLTEQTDDLSEALWIHAAQAELARLTDTDPLSSRLDHLIDISPAARAQLSEPNAGFTLFRRSPPEPLLSGATHSGWVITLPEETNGATAVEQISGAELAYYAPALVTALALPPRHVVLVEGEAFRWVSRIDPAAPGSGTPPRTILRWDPPAPETVSYTAHGIEFFTEVDPEYRAEVLQILNVVNQRTASDFVDNYALNFGLIFLVFRTEGEGRMRVKTTDVSHPGTEHSTPNLTWGAKLRRAQLETKAMLGNPTWTDVNNSMVTMRVFPGALDGPVITMHREPPAAKDSGWVFGSGSGEPHILHAHEVYYREPAVATYFPLPPGYEVTLRGGRLERVLDGGGSTVWPRT